MDTFLWGALVVAVGLAGLLGARFLRDRGLDPSVSRRLGAACGGAAYLLAVLRLDAFPAIALAVGMAALVVLLRLRRADLLRGVAAPAASRWGEVAFPIAGAVT